LILFVLLGDKMKRLKAKPRRKKKELKFTIKFVFEAFSDNEDEAKGAVRAFKNWMKDIFPEWGDTILEHFLYQHGLSQNSKDNKYLLTLNMDKVIKDESSVKDARIFFDNKITEIDKDAEEKMEELEAEMMDEE